MAVCFIKQQKEKLFPSLTRPQEEEHEKKNKRKLKKNKKANWIKNIPFDCFTAMFLIVALLCGVRIKNNNTVNTHNS